MIQHVLGNSYMVLKSNIANYMYWFTCLLRKEDIPREVYCYSICNTSGLYKVPLLCFVAKIDNFLTTPFKCFLQLKALTNFNMTSNIKRMTKVVCCKIFLFTKLKFSYQWRTHKKLLSKLPFNGQFNSY